MSLYFFVVLGFLMLGRVSVGKQELAAVSIDELIDALPPIGGELSWDPVAQAYVWNSAAAELRDRLQAGVEPTDAQWHRLLVETGVLQWRSLWPKDVPFAIAMRQPLWLWVARIRVKPRRNDLEGGEVGMLVAERCGTAAEVRRQAALYQVLGTLSLGRHSLVFDVQVDQAGSRDTSLRDPIHPLRTWSGALRLDVQIVDDLTDALPGRASESLNEAVEQSVSLAYSNWYGDGEELRRTPILVVDPDTARFPALASLALSLQIELLHRGRVVHTQGLIAHAYDSRALEMSVNEGPSRTIGFTALDEIPLAAEGELAEWSVRLTGSSDQVLRLWGATVWWNGSIEVRLDLAREREVVRAGDEGREPWVWSPHW